MSSNKQSSVVIKQFGSRDKLLDCVVMNVASFTLVFLSGRAETDGAREVHMFLRKYVLSSVGEKEILLFLDNLSFVSSTALGTFANLNKAARKYFIVSGIKPEIRKGLAAVGVLPGKENNVFYFDNILQVSTRLKINPKLTQLMLKKHEEMTVFESTGLREADIVKSYYPDLTENEIRTILREQYSNISAAYSSNFLVLPASYLSVVAVYTFIRRVAKDYGFYNLSDDDHFLSEYDCEVIAKEIVENIVNWAYENRKGAGFILKAAIDDNKLSIGFADWGSGYKPNFIKRILGLGGQGHKRLEGLARSIDGNAGDKNLIRFRSPAPTLRATQKADIEKKLGPQKFEKGSVFIIRFPILNEPDVEYQTNGYPATGL